MMAGCFAGAAIAVLWFAWEAFQDWRFWRSLPRPLGELGSQRRHRGEGLRRDGWT